MVKTVGEQRIKEMRIHYRDCRNGSLIIVYVRSSKAEEPPLYNKYRPLP